MRVGIVISSDRASRGDYEDKSGPALSQLIQHNGWTEVGVTVVADEAAGIQRAIDTFLTRESADLVLVCGGTGPGPRDVAPDAIREMPGREMPGFGEMMRSKASTPFAILSRSGAFVVRERLVLALPGKPAAAVESVEAIAFALPHAVAQARGETHENPSKV